MSRPRALETDESSEQPRKYFKPDNTDDDSGVSGSEADSQSNTGDNHLLPGPSAIVNVPTIESIDVIDSTSERYENLKRDEIKAKTESLAHFIIRQVADESASNSGSPDEIESTLLRCVNTMMMKHEILFKGMMRRLSINDETAYTAFLTVANELFEGEQMIVNWGKIVALYAFGGQLALYCKEKGLTECGARIPEYLGRYARDGISTFIENQGGWSKICEEFPPDDDLDQKVWKFLTWTAVGLGLATAASFFTSR